MGNKKKKHYHIVKQVICDLKGESCCGVYPYGDAIAPDCRGCDWYEDDKEAPGARYEPHNDSQMD